jgi:hypothetical protein
MDCTKVRAIGYQLSFENDGKIIIENAIYPSIKNSFIDFLLAI